MSLWARFVAVGLGVASVACSSSDEGPLGSPAQAGGGMGAGTNTVGGGAAGMLAALGGGHVGGASGSATVGDATSAGAPVGGGSLGGTGQALGGAAVAGAGSQDPPSDFDIEAHLLASAEGAPSEAAAAGVPSNWDWVAGATGTSTSPPDAAHSSANYWGALFRGPANTTAVNTLVQLRNCSMWLLREGATEWTKTDSSVELGGATFSPTYAGGGPDPIVLEQLATGTNVVPAVGHIWHFWQGNSYQPVAGKVREIITNCQSRLALRNAGGQDDRGQADYLVHMGADWRDPSDPSCANDDYICPSWGVSRFERVTAAWRNHTFHSVTKADLDAGVPLPPASLFTVPAI